jgi:hypothetical protein
MWSSLTKASPVARVAIAAGAWQVVSAILQAPPMILRSNLPKLCELAGGADRVLDLGGWY